MLDHLRRVKVPFLDAPSGTPTRQPNSVHLPLPQINSDFAAESKLYDSSSCEILIACVFRSPKESLSGNAICTRIRKTIGICCVGKDPAWEVQVLLELIQNENFVSISARSWRRPFGKLRWQISQQAYDQYSPYKNSKRKPTAAVGLATRPPFELDAAPDLQELDANPVPPTSSATIIDRSITINPSANQTIEYESSAINSDRTIAIGSSANPSIKFESKFPSYAWGLENRDNSTSWSVIATKYGPVPFPLLPCDLSSPDDISAPELGWSSGTSKTITDRPSSSQNKIQKHERLEVADSPFIWQPIPKVPISKNCFKVHDKRMNPISSPKLPQLPLGRVCSRRIVTTTTYTEDDSKASTPPTPLLSAEDELRIFTAVPVTQYAQAGENGQSSKQGHHSGASSDGANSNSKLNPKLQSKAFQGSEQRTNRDNADDDDQEENPRKRKRFPPGDDPSSDYPSNGRKFACVYHKFDPQQYGVRNRKYLVCEGTGFRYISELIRHLARTHDIFICNRCLSKIRQGDRDDHSTHCEVRLRCPQPEKWHKIWRNIFPFAVPCSNPYFEPSSWHPTDSNKATSARDRSGAKPANQRPDGNRETASASDCSLDEDSAGPSVSRESTLVEEDAAPRCGCARMDKGKAPQTRSPATGDFALPLQISIQLLGGRVKSLERRLPFIEETIKMLSNLMSLRGSPDTLKDSAVTVQPTSTSDSQTPILPLNHDPCTIELSWDLDTMREKSGSLQAAAKLPHNPSAHFEPKTSDAFRLSDLFGGDLDSMDLTKDPSTALFDNDMLLGHWQSTI